MSISLLDSESSALVAMSGGVDSSAAAYLMLSRGVRCAGVTMRLYRNPDIGLGQFHPCCSQRDIDDAAEVAFHLDISHEVLDFVEDFREQVMARFIRTYEAGGTPNPCIDCNRYMKFDKLLRHAEAHGFGCIVTGHYARIEYDAAVGRYLLKKAADAHKDQSYVLYALTQYQLARTRFPLGTMQKEEIRALAGKIGLCNARKHDSQDICFVPDGDYAGFMEHARGRRYPEGDFLNAGGEIIGRHRGAVRYTLGQRRGLGISLGQPAYVVGKDMARNTVSLGPEASLYSRVLLAEDVNWISVSRLDGPLRCRAKTRYRQLEQPATVYPEGEGRIRVEFDAPQRAMTVGQAVVLYDGETVVGGGTIAEVPR